MGRRPPGPHMPGSATARQYYVLGVETHDQTANYQTHDGQAKEYEMMQKRDGIHILLKRSWVDFEIRSSNSNNTIHIFIGFNTFKKCIYFMFMFTIVMKPPHARREYKIQAMITQ